MAENMKMPMTKEKLQDLQFKTQITDIDRTGEEVMRKTHGNKTLPYRTKDDNIDYLMVQEGKITLDEEVKEPKEYFREWQGSKYQGWEKKYKDHVNYKELLRQRFGDSVYRAQVLEALEELINRGRVSDHVDPELIRQVKEDKANII
jgi:hypothetical protein